MDVFDIPSRSDVSSVSTPEVIEGKSAHYYAEREEQKDKRRDCLGLLRRLNALRARRPPELSPLCNTALSIRSTSLLLAAEPDIRAYWGNNRAGKVLTTTPSSEVWLFEFAYGYSGPPQSFLCNRHWLILLESPKGPADQQVCCEQGIEQAEGAARQVAEHFAVCTHG